MAKSKKVEERDREAEFGYIKLSFKNILRTVQNQNWEDSNR